MMRFIEINDERHNKGLRIRYKVFNELEFSETKVVCRGAVCASIKQSRIITIPNLDQVNLLIFHRSTTLNRNQFVFLELVGFFPERLHHFSSFCSSRRNQIGHGSFQNDDTSKNNQETIENIFLSLVFKGFEKN